MYTFSPGPEEQSPPSCDEKGSACDGWKDGASLGKDTRAVQSIKHYFFYQTPLSLLGQPSNTNSAVFFNIVQRGGS